MSPGRNRTRAASSEPERWSRPIAQTTGRSSTVATRPGSRRQACRANSPLLPPMSSILRWPDTSIASSSGPASWRVSAVVYPTQRRAAATFSGFTAKQRS